jgi:hypothetical protein
MNLKYPMNLLVPDEFTDVPDVPDVPLVPDVP